MLNYLYKQRGDMVQEVFVRYVKYGVSFGTALAIAISFTTNHSVLWAIIHGLFSWLYVIYYLLVRGV
jgi:hypothetical protein